MADRLCAQEEGSYNTTVNAHSDGSLSFSTGVSGWLSTCTQVEKASHSCQDTWTHGPYDPEDLNNCHVTPLGWEYVGQMEPCPGRTYSSSLTLWGHLVVFSLVPYGCLVINPTPALIPVRLNENH